VEQISEHVLRPIVLPAALNSSPHIAHFLIRITGCWRFRLLRAVHRRRSRSRRHSTEHVFMKRVDAVAKSSPHVQQLKIMTVR
jgi:hypothetical protein